MRCDHHSLALSGVKVWEIFCSALESHLRTIGGTVVNAMKNILNTIKTRMARSRVYIKYQGDLDYGLYYDLNRDLSQTSFAMIINIKSYPQKKKKITKIQK